MTEITSQAKNLREIFSQQFAKLQENEDENMDEPRMKKLEKEKNGKVKEKENEGGDVLNLDLRMYKSSLMWLEFLGLMASGIAGDRVYHLEEFLVHRLTKEKLAEWTKLATQDINNVISGIQDFMIPVVNSLVFLTSEFAGYTKW